MIKVECTECGQPLYKSPSKVNPRNYCNMSCYAKTRDRELVKFGFKFPKGRPEMPNRLKAMKKLSGVNHYAWKGEEVGYRGLHQWLWRKLGKPIKCQHCSKVDNRPKYIQWANVDGKYHRVLKDYISLCTSCHKIYDLNIATIQGVRTAK